MNNLYDILEICLQELENGADLEALLARYPDMATELRPMLQVATTAKLVAAPVPSMDIVKRNQAKVLQRYDQAIEAKAAATRSWFPMLQRRVVAFAIFLLVFFFSGTNLVRASFSSLPGDGLYPVKRSWEETRLLLTFDTTARENLEVQFEGERLKELNQLLATGRTVHVDFVGSVSQIGDDWEVASVSVVVSDQTRLPEKPVQVGDTVHVSGTTRGEGVVLAERIELITVSVNTPAPTAVATDSEVETEVAATPQPDNDNSGSETETPDSSEIKTPSPTPKPKTESFEGILVSMDQSLWTINDVTVESDNAEVKGTPFIGATVKAEGYFSANGIFIASKLEIINVGLNNNGGSGSNSNTNSSNNTGNTNSGNNSSNNTNTDTSNSNDDNGGGGGGNDNGGGHGGGG